MLARGDQAALELLVQQLLTSYHALRAHGAQDYPTAVLASALSRIGRAVDAGTILREYMERFRREPTELPESIRSLCVALEVPSNDVATTIAG